MKYLILSPLVCCLAFTNVSAQITPGTIYLPHDNPPKVTTGSKTKTLAWCGGVNNPQLNMADLNKDGIKDLVIYENGKGVRTFINTSSVKGNPVYVHKAGFEANFPVGFPGIEYWMILKDYNGDGIPDLFHGGYPGVNLHRGYYNAGGALCFRFYKQLWYKFGAHYSNVYVSTADIPAIADIDKDGDLDIVSFDILTNGVLMTYYRNCGKEDGLHPDSFKVCVKDGCWGRSQQPGKRGFIPAIDCSYLGGSCKTSKVTDGANAITIFDYDNDGDADIFNGNKFYPDVALARNGKADLSLPMDSLIWQDSIWGSNGKQLHIPMMPHTAWMDIDNDGSATVEDNDLIFTPFLSNTENHKSIAYYKNMGNNAAPNYVYQSDSFLVEDMIDVGSASYPVLYDYNKDGKLDMFVGNDGYFQESSSSNRTAIQYYQNTSPSDSQLSFNLVTYDFLGLFATNSKGSAMTMGDVNDDGKDDLLIGKADGTIRYYENTASSASTQPNWQNPYSINDQYGTLRVDTGIGGAGYATPFIYDVDADGRKDIVCGSQSGKLIYFRNTTSSPGGAPSFYRMTDSLGGIGLQEDGNSYSYTVPFIGKIDNTGKTYLLLGSKKGILYKYDSIVPGNTTYYRRIDTLYNSIKVYDRSAPFAADLNGDNKYELFVGSILGGVRLYEQYFNVGVENLSFSDNGITLYPNPASNSIHVAWKPEFAQHDLRISLMTVTGVKVWGGVVAKDRTETEISVESLPSGTYFCIVQSGTNRAVTPVSLVK